MKLKGEKISKANLEICVIPRGDGDPIVFKCKSVLDMEAFEKLCPQPKIPVRIKAGGVRVDDIEDPIYKGQKELRDEKRIHYLILKSLEATEDLEWETVKISDSDSWQNYQDELKESGFSTVEVGRIITSVMRANCLDEAKLEQARAAFLLSQEQEKEDQ